MSSVPAASLSQIDVAQLKAYADRVSAAPEVADQKPRVIARWAGESRSEVTVRLISTVNGLSTGRRAVVGESGWLTWPVPAAAGAPS